MGAVNFSTGALFSFDNALPSSTQSPSLFLKPTFMSVQHKKTGFELDETDFPELSAKGTGRKEKGRRSQAGARHARQLEHAGAILMKTVEDPDQVLGKRRKERVASKGNDGLAANVFYSMNKNKRWDDVSSSSLLEIECELPVEVVERVITSKRTNDNVVAVQTIRDNGERRVLTSSGCGTNLNALVSGPGTKVRGRKARKEAEAQMMEEAENSYAVSSKTEEVKAPRIQYTIYKPHTNHRVLAGKIFNRGYNTKKAGRARGNLRKVDISEIESSELDQSVHLEDSTVYKPSRDFKFCLGDYITENTRSSKQQSAIYVRRQSIESVHPSSDTTCDEDDDGPRPFSLLDISNIVRAPGAFEWVLIDTSKWQTKFTFAQQIEKLVDNELLYVQWLDADKQRVSIDASRLALPKGQPHAAPVLVIVVEKNSSKKNHIRLLFNSDIAPTGPFSWQILKSLLKHTNNMEEIVSILAKLIGEWKRGNAPECVDRSATKSRFDLRRDNFQPAFNSQLLARPAQVLTAEHMATLVREGGRHSESEGDSFEHISVDDEFSSSSEFSVVEESIVGNVKCDTCSSHHAADLFELDDCWQCRDCLRQQIVSQIRSKSVPLEIPFVLRDGQSTYDNLPAIIPLPLLNFYTKLAATHMLEHSDDETGELGECPSCKQLVQVERPNEYNTCSCVSCGIHWCPDCGTEPHWPMDCVTYSSWMSKWDKEYRHHILEKTDFIKKIKCSCDAELEVRENAPEAECDGCGRVFEPTTMRLIYLAYWHKDEKTGELVLRNDDSEFLVTKSVETVPASKTIKKEFSDACGEARKLRFSSSVKAEFEKSVRKLKDSVSGVEKLRDLRKTVLVLVENGLAFVYNAKNKECSALKQHLMQLLKQWRDIECELQNPRSDFGARIAAVDKNVSNTIDMVKTYV